ELELEFPDEATELRTRAVHYIARQVPVGRNGCDALWGSSPRNLAQAQSVVEYPNRTDVRALAIDLAPYDELNFFVYAHTTTDVVSTPAIAGGCVMAPVSADSTTGVVVRLEPAP
ncbi:MAG: hypothetical protein AAF449_04675, partial [Myxococcota bacterium]